ncbi:hypothetical protein Acr_25g0010220 [Actinidia rufa]|uniref:Uncharacterized protein n=1 Tax=Actinidia rufa TaxID=165716 RepID=A0A7J0H0K4_9ERIC|nr:hypothetical protein Acr_25g0010220 [Actinidia rufa]
MSESSPETPSDLKGTVTWHRKIPNELRPIDSLNVAMLMNVTQALEHRFRVPPDFGLMKIPADGVSDAVGQAAAAGNRRTRERCCATWVPHSLVVSAPKQRRIWGQYWNLWCNLSLSKERAGLVHWGSFLTHERREMRRRMVSEGNFGPYNLG